MTDTDGPQLSDDLAERLGRALDREAKITRALDALGPIADRDVLLLDDPPRLTSGLLTSGLLTTSGARVTPMKLER